MLQFKKEFDELTHTMRNSDSAKFDRILFYAEDATNPLSNEENNLKISYRKLEQMICCGGNSYDDLLFKKSLNHTFEEVRKLAITNGFAINSAG